MRVAVVGTGFARQVHLPAYRQVADVQLTAICDIRPRRAEQVAAEYGADRWCNDFSDVLSMADVDVVDICTPPKLHAPMAIAALSSGKAVICEKPMSSDLESASKMATTAAESGLPAAIHFQSRYISANRYLRQLIADGYLGHIRLVVITALGDYALDPNLEPHYATWASMAAEGGGFLSSAMAHSLDLAQYVFGRIEPKSVIKQTDLPRKPVLAWDFLHDDPLSEASPTSGSADVTGDDTAVIQGILSGGGVVVAAGSWAVRNGGGTRIAAYGSEGTITLDASGGLLAARGNDQLAALLVPAADDRQDVPTLFAAMARDFQAQLRGEEAPPEGYPFATFEDGLAVQRIIASASHSQRSDD